MNLLFLCNQGKNRSRMASEMWLEMRPDDKVMARGLYRHDSTELKKLFVWADKIIVMEEKHIRKIKEIDTSLHTYVKIINFDIPDMYDYGSRGLKRILLDKFKRINRCAATLFFSK